MKKLILIICLLFISNTFGHAKTYEGLYSYGGEIHSFTPCNSKISYWISYNFAGIEMNDFYKKNHKKTISINVY